jgi:hypothetical protein
MLGSLVFLGFVLLVYFVKDDGKPDASGDHCRAD